MKLRVVCLFMLVCLSMMFLAREVSAQEEVRPLEPDWLQQMYEEGWQKIQEGVLKRDVGEGRFETFGYGAEGLVWLIESYRQQLTYFEGKYRQEPTDELASLIDQLTDDINRLQGDALAAPTAESFDGEQLEDCPYEYGGTAEAGPLTSAQGVMASASAYFHNNCGLIGTTDAVTYAHAIGETTRSVNDSDPQTGTSVQSYSTISVYGSLECESKAQALVQVQELDFFYQTPEVLNNSCPDGVSISGPAQVATDYYGQVCADVTWTASASSGRTDYTFEWYIGTTLEGTGTSLTKRYCNETKNETVQVVARDNAGWSDDATFTTSIVHTPSVVASASGPATVTTDYYSSPCATVTWTASATGGHPGYTYNWYIGTSSTVQGTGSTFSKQYCNTSQAVTVKAVVQDSDGHTANATYTTDIVYKPALTVSVSGPSTATADYYGPTCVNVTWTASAVNGHPGYTYNWYLGTGTTSQGTGSTFTKSYCPTSNQSATVKAVATDSDGHTATSATFTTDLNYKRPIVASITGPATAYLNTSCVDVTWTAGASGSGHSGYTYKWYLGTSTTLQGSGSSFTKRYCSATTATVKLVATASDNHADDVTFTTKISPPPAPTVSISGPAEVSGTTNCQTVTWTANVSGGTPAYSYSWTIGTNTTVLSTTSSLTKSICLGTTDVKLTVRDSASQTANATFSTTVTKEITCYMPNCNYVY